MNSGMSPYGVILEQGVFHAYILKTIYKLDYIWILLIIISITKQTQPNGRMVHGFNQPLH